MAVQQLHVKRHTTLCNRKRDAYAPSAGELHQDLGVSNLIVSCNPAIVYTFKLCCDVIGLIITIMLLCMKLS